VTCAGSGPCTMGDALGLRACSFRPVPHAIPEDMSLAPAEDDPSGAEVRGTGKRGPATLLLVRRAGRLVLRGGVRSASNVVVFLTDTVEDGACGPSRRERAVMVAEPEAPIPPPQVDLTAAPEVAIDVRVAHRSAAGLEALTLAARTAAAAHLDGLAGCWAQQALSLIASQRQRRTQRRSGAPSIRVESVRLIVRATPPAAR
jgi:hypothetical protein